MERILDPSGFRGKRIALTAGSRKIAELPLILRTVIRQLVSWGARPFIVPAMGSHGGADAEGQREVLTGYGITEETMGAPVISSMEVVRIASLDDGLPVYCDKTAFESDGIVVVNRVKPHTDFKGAYESGLLKMMGIGLGNHKGATDDALARVRPDGRPASPGWRRSSSAARRSRSGWPSWKTPSTS